MGYSKAILSGDPFIINAAPTLSPTAFPTKFSAILAITQRYDGITEKSVTDENMLRAIMKVMAEVTNTPEDSFSFSGYQVELY